MLAWSRLMPTVMRISAPCAKQSGAVELDNSTFSGNQAGEGGGIAFVVDNEGTFPDESFLSCLANITVTANIASPVAAGGIFIDTDENADLGNIEVEIHNTTHDLKLEGEFTAKNGDVVTTDYVATGPSQQPLDGEWDNPGCLCDDEGDEFPSENNIDGGGFVYRFNILPADFTRDLEVAFVDFLALSANFGAFEEVLVIDGDGQVTFTDFLQLSMTIGLSL